MLHSVNKLYKEHNLNKNILNALVVKGGNKKGFTDKFSIFIVLAILLTVFLGFGFLLFSVFLNNEETASVSSDAINNSLFFVGIGADLNQIFIPIAIIVFVIGLAIGLGKLLKS